jgi:hypothetical protein
VVIATPIDLGRIIKINKPSTKVDYDLQEIGKPDLNELIGDFLDKNGISDIINIPRKGNPENRSWKNELEKGLVIKTTGSWHTVRDSEKKAIPCKIKG